jgi:hypothetical protein
VPEEPDSLTRLKMLRELQETGARAGHANGQLKEAKDFARAYQTIQPDFQKNKGHTARGDVEKRRKKVGADVESREERRRRLKAAGFEAFSKAPFSASQSGDAAKALEGSEDSKEPPTGKNEKNEKNEKKTDQTTRVEPTTREKRKTDDDAAVLGTGGGAEGGRAGGGAENGGSTRASPPVGKKRKKNAGRGAEGEGASDISEREFEDIVSHLQRTVASDGGRKKNKKKGGARLPPHVQSGSRDQRYCIWVLILLLFMWPHTAAVYVASYGIASKEYGSIDCRRERKKKHKAIADEKEKITESTPRKNKNRKHSSAWVRILLLTEYSAAICVS